LGFGSQQRQKKEYETDNRVCFSIHILSCHHILRFTAKLGKVNSKLEIAPAMSIFANAEFQVDLDG